MEYCTGSDLSFYIKQRGKLDTLDFVPRPGMFPGKGPLSLDQNGKMFWPHPAAGGIEERVTRCFLGQLGELLFVLMYCLQRAKLISSRSSAVSEATEFDTSGYQASGKLIRQG
jgi:hypothetical protein